MPAKRSEAGVAAIVLAAGLSTRMGGEPKPLLPLGDRSVVEHILSVLAGCPVQETIVVTGHKSQEVEACLTGWQALRPRAAGPVRTAFNPRYAQGEMLSSIQVGLGSISANSSAALVVLGDQPALASSVVRAVIAAYRAGQGSLVVPSFQMRRGHPLLIDKRHWSAILQLDEGRTLRDFVQTVETEIYHVPVDSPGILRDMDTPAEYQRELIDYQRRRHKEAVRVV